MQVTWPPLIGDAGGKAERQFTTLRVNDNIDVPAPKK